MSRAPYLVIDGRLYRWKDILELRRAQLAAAEPRRLASLRSLQPCTTIAARPPSARHPGAICNRACLPHKALTASGPALPPVSLSVSAGAKTRTVARFLESIA